MKTIKVLLVHVQKISKYQKADLSKEIDKFISDHQNLNESELLNEIYTVYGNQIKLLENAVRCKAIINIKEWISTIGILIVIGIILWIINFAILTIK